MMKPRHKNRISLEGNGMDDKAADIRKDGFVIRGAANWDLLCWEMKKLWSQPMILVFLLLCIVFQIFLAAEDRYLEPGGDYAIYVARMTKETGRRMGREFTEAMDGAGKNMRNMDAKDETLPWEKQDGEEQNEQRKEGQDQDRQDQDGQIAVQAKGEQEPLYRERFLRETADREDIFADYSCMKLADGLLRQFYITGWPARMMERKYEKQQEAVDLLAERNDFLDISSAGMTQPVADALFQTQCRMLITEAMVLAMLMALSVSGSERTARTHLTICVTRTGRKIQYVKAAAGLWWSQNQWFTDMLISGAVPWQKCATAALWTVLCLILLAVSFHHMMKEDIN